MFALIRACLLSLVAAQAAVASDLDRKDVNYQHDELSLRGYLVAPTGAEARAARRPGILVVHEWWGLNDHARRQADRLAREGYVAFALDMYGEGMKTDDPHKAGELAGRFRSDRDLLVKRARAGLDVLLKDARVDPKRVAVIGYCFGGSTALQMALAGVDVAGVVSLHGALGGLEPRPGVRITARILILHGADDPLIPAAHISEFQEILRKAGADWQMVYLGRAVHSFTNRDAGRANMKGVAYDEAADRRSWQYMRDFFAELFSSSPTPAGER